MKDKGVKDSLVVALSWIAAIALFLTPPALLIYLKVPALAVVCTALGCVGWCFMTWVLWGNKTVLNTIRSSAEQLGLMMEPSADLETAVSTFAEEAKRYHRAAFSCRLEDQLETRTVGENLERLLHLAQTELAASSVELSLFDEETGMWTQAMLIGRPCSLESQSMLLGEIDRSAIDIIAQASTSSQTVCASPLTFAGRLFGALRVEVDRQRTLTKNDQQVVQLLANQAALMMIDAEFTDEILRMKRLGEESIKAKTGFLANLSHEIRGPLGIILNGAELALEGLCGELTPPMHDSLKMIKDSGEHLLDLVNDVLDYAKVEAGKIVPNSVVLQVKPLLEDLVSVVRSQAVAKHHKLTLAATDESMGVLCDKRHIRQMLINFLTNAVKYTPDGGKIEVWAEKISLNRVKIFIKDSGIGIPESQSHKVFGAFERVEDKYAQMQKGTGLGMPLTKSLAEVNDGAVGFESESGKGSTFWLVLPAAEIDKIVEIQDDQNDGLVFGQGHGELVLIVDHDQSTRSMLGMYLQEQGFQTACVSSATEMIRVLRNQPVEIAIVENDFPDLPGEEVVASIRGVPTAAGIPIILLSARAFVFDIERFLKLGVDRCLSKPVPLAELAVTVRRLIDQDRSLERPATH